MKNEYLAYDLISGEFIYRVLESAKLIPQDDFKKYFNSKGIKFPVELFTKIRYAKSESVKEYLSNKGSQDMHYWLQDKLNEAKKYQELRQHYLNIFAKQLKDIRYRKWKYMDMYISFMSLKNSL